MPLRALLIALIVIGGGLLAFPLSNPADSVSATDSTRIDRIGILAQNPEPAPHIIWWRAAIFAATATGCISYGFSEMGDWWGHGYGSFKIKHDDWSGDNLAQTDEASHFFITYKLAQTGTEFSKWSGFSPGTSRIIGSSIAVGVMTLVEYPIDAHNPVQGLGYSDLIADYLGVYFAAVKDKWPEKLKYFDFRFSVKNPGDVPNGVIAQTFAGNDAYIYWLSVMPVEDFPAHASIGISANHDSPDRKVEREIYLGFGTSGAELAGIFSKKWRRRLDFWNAYEISFSLRVD
jgi:hypothetical protein